MARRKARQAARLDGVWQCAWDSISPALQAEVEKGVVSLSGAVSRTLAEAQSRTGTRAAAV